MPRPSFRPNASASWLRQELPTQTNSTPGNCRSETSEAIGDDLQKILMNQWIGAQLRMKGRGQQPALPDQYGSVIAPGQRGHPATNLLDHRSANEYHLQGFVPQHRSPSK